jgi:hypothetical protein
VSGVASFGTAAATGSQVIVRGGSLGTPMLTLKRTSGAISQFSWALAGGGLSFSDDTNGAIVGNMFGTNSTNALYLGQNGTVTGGANTRSSLLSGTTVSSSLGSDLSVGNLTIQAGLGTGAGTPGDLILSTGTVLATGSNPQTPAARVIIKNTNGYVGIGTVNPEQPLTVYGKGVFFPHRIGSGDARSFQIDYNATNPTFIDNNYPVVLKTGGGNQPLILDAARIGIGTSSPDQMLTVNGTVHAKEIKVDTSIPAPDYVFEPTYKLPLLRDLKTYLDANHHLPEIPSAKEIEKDGLNLSEMNLKLLKKVEELTLYVIEKDKEIKDVKQSQQTQIEELKAQVTLIQKQVNNR